MQQLPVSAGSLGTQKPLTADLLCTYIARHQKTNGRFADAPAPAICRESNEEPSDRLVRGFIHTSLQLLDHLGLDRLLPGIRWAYFMQLLDIDFLLLHAGEREREREREGEREREISATSCDPLRRSPAVSFWNWNIRKQRPH